MNFGRWLGCHQMPERSFFIKGYQLPICARCTGVYIGQIVALILLFFLRIPWYISVILIVPMGIDWSLQYFVKIISNNVRRLITGLLCGFGLMYLYAHVISQIVEIILKLF